MRVTKYKTKKSIKLKGLEEIIHCMSFCFSELLRSCWNASGGNLVHERGVCSRCGKIFFMSETEHTCSCLCHPLFSRQKIPKKSHSRSLYLADSDSSDHSKCLSTSTAVCQTSSTATRCPVWLPRYPQDFFWSKWVFKKLYLFLYALVIFTYCFV